MASLLIALLLVSTPLPTAERCAAMLLSPGAELRKAGKDAILAAGNAKYEKAVLLVLADRAYSRTQWIADLEKELEGSQGPRHKTIRELLTILRFNSQDNVGVDVVVLSVPADVSKRLFGAARPTVVYPDDRVWARWWLSLDSTKGVQQLMRTSLPGKDALLVTAEKTKQISYMRAFEVKGDVGHTVVDQLEVGVFASWRPTISLDGQHITIDLDLRLADVERPIAVKETVVGKFKTRVQVPVFRERRTRTTVTLPIGGCAVLPFRGDPTVLIFVRANLGAPKGVPALKIPEAEVGTVRRDLRGEK